MDKREFARRRKKLMDIVDGGGIAIQPTAPERIRNRDVLLEVNGHKLNTRAQLLLAYLALKNDRAFDLVFQRQGQRLVHHYEIER